MDGVAVIRELLVGNAALLALVPDEQIVGGVLPANTPLNAIAINTVSTVDRNILAPRATRHVRERIRVTYVAADYPALKAVRRTAKRACADFIGSAAGLEAVTVQTDGAGPDFMDEQASLHMSTQDFMVAFTEVR